MSSTRTRRFRRIVLALLPSILLAACGDEGDGLVNAGLPETGLVGEYSLKGLRRVYKDGREVTQNAPPKGTTLRLAPDSILSQSVFLNGTSPKGLTGKITSVRVESGDRSQGELVLFASTPEGLKAETAQFEVRADTLQLTWHAGADSDPSGIGFTETDWWVRAAPKQANLLVEPK